MTVQRKTFFFVLLSVFLLCTAFIIQQATLTPAVMGGSDSSVFATMGWSWTNGLIPYKDIFDHKGPVLYLLNAAGFWLAGDFYGIVYIEILNLLLFSLLFLVLNRNNSLVYLCFFSLMLVLFFSKTFEGGNLTEEYALLLNGISACVWLKKSRWRFFVYGLMGSLLFLLRVNLAAASLIIFIIDVYQSKDVLRAFISTSAAFLLPLLLCVVYFYYHDALKEFYESYFLFNFTYTQGGGFATILQSYKILLFQKVKAGFLGIFLLGLIYFRQKKFFIHALIILVFPFLFASISGRSYMHYMNAIAPSIFLCFSIAMQDLNTDKPVLDFIVSKTSRYMQRPLAVFCSACAVTLILLNIVVYKNKFDFEQLELIRNSFDELDISSSSKILSLSNHCASKIYYLSRTVPPERDFYPVTAAITDKARTLATSRQPVCPDPRYDFLLLSSSQQLSESCPYTHVYTLDTNKLYKSVR